MKPVMRAAVAGVLTVALAGPLAIASCGGGGPDNPGGPSPSPSPNPTPNPPPNPTATTTITITSSGVSPKDIVVARGSRVTFVNSDGVPHDMNSDPHPQHNSCDDMNVGFIASGQSGMTQVLNIARTCGYHDHNQPSNANLWGTITIQ
jgi:hypothetical protein